MIALSILILYNDIHPYTGVKPITAFQEQKRVLQTRVRVTVFLILLASAPTSSDTVTVPATTIIKLS